MGMGRDSPTCKLQNKPLFIQNLMVLDEKRLVLKGIPMGSRVKPTMGMGMGMSKMPDIHGFPCAIC